LIGCDGNDDLSGINGIDEDLVVKAFQWKGNNKTLRQFNRDASHNELGMQADIYMVSKGDIYMNSKEDIYTDSKGDIYMNSKEDIYTDSNRGIQ